MRAICSTTSSGLSFRMHCRRQLERRSMSGVARIRSPKNEVWRIAEVVTRESVDLQDRKKRFLRNLHAADLLHARLSFLLLL